MSYLTITARELSDICFVKLYVRRESGTVGKRYFLNFSIEMVTKIIN